MNPWEGQIFEVVSAIISENSSFNFKPVFISAICRAVRSCKVSSSARNCKTQSTAWLVGIDLKRLTAPKDTSISLLLGPNTLVANRISKLNRITVLTAGL